MCEKYGGGRAAWDPGDLISLNEPVACEPYPTPRGIAARLTRNVHQDQACSACFAALVRALYAAGHEVKEEIYIGQGWQGKAPEGLGIGKCCRGAETCVMGCPPTAEAIVRALEERHWA